MRKNSTKDYTVGSGNVFRDLGFDNPEEEFTKVKLASIINDNIDERGLTKQEASAIIGVNQSEILALKNGRLNEFSIEVLFSFLNKLNQPVDIKINRKSTTVTEPEIQMSE